MVDRFAVKRSAMLLVDVMYCLEKIMTLHFHILRLGYKVQRDFIILSSLRQRCCFIAIYLLLVVASVCVNLLHEFYT